MATVTSRARCARRRIDTRASPGAGRVRRAPDILSAAAPAGCAQRAVAYSYEAAYVRLARGALAVHTGSVSQPPIHLTDAVHAQLSSSVRSWAWTDFDSECGSQRPLARWEMTFS